MKVLAEVMARLDVPLGGQVRMTRAVGIIPATP